MRDNARRVAPEIGASKLYLSIRVIGACLLPSAQSMTGWRLNTWPFLAHVLTHTSPFKTARLIRLLWTIACRMRCKETPCGRDHSSGVAFHSTSDSYTVLGGLRLRMFYILCSRECTGERSGAHFSLGKDWINPYLWRNRELSAEAECAPPSILFA